MTRVPELLAAGVPFALGHDCLMDPWYSLGSGDMLEVAHMGLYVAQMTGQDGMQACVRAVTETPAAILGLEGYGIAPGCNVDPGAIASERSGGGDSTACDATCGNTAWRSYRSDSGATGDLEFTGTAGRDEFSDLSIRRSRHHSRTRRVGGHRRLMPALTEGALLRQL